jgi:hypothetical protein
MIIFGLGTIIYTIVTMYALRILRILYIDEQRIVKDKITSTTSHIHACLSAQ